MGVFPVRMPLNAVFAALPHARGGGSCANATQCSICGSSPRPWGCFRHRHKTNNTTPLFPTPVGVVPSFCVLIQELVTLPHARGGVSTENAAFSAERSSSPRPWGCFWQRLRHKIPRALFPTPVGVFPRVINRVSETVPLPHARGGVSFKSSFRRIVKHSSPRPWGCFRGIRHGFGKRFLFPTLVKGMLWNQKRLSILIASIEREEQETSQPIRLSPIQMQFDFGAICMAKQKSDKTVFFKTDALHTGILLSTPRF